MKKRTLIMIALAVILILIFAACSALQKDTDDVPSASVSQSAENTETSVKAASAFEKNAAQRIDLNETVSLTNYEFTLNLVELSYDVKPMDTSGFYSHYAADPGEVYLHIDADVKNLGKQNIGADEIYSVTADYNNGYTYSGFAFVEEADGDFSYANITSVKPLQMLGVHYLITCPQEVETNTSAPLKITITFKDGTNYTYVVR